MATSEVLAGSRAERDRPAPIGARILAITRRPRITVLLRAAIAFVGGLLAYLSFPPHGLWFLGPIGLAVLIGSLQVVGNRTDESAPAPSRPPGRLSKRAGFAVGLAGGLGIFLPMLPFVGIYVGAQAWIALSVVMALYIGGFGAMATRLRNPFALALLWVAWDWARGAFPFGGFPWGRLAFGQSDGPLLSLARVGGTPLLTFAVALTAACLWRLATAFVPVRPLGRQKTAESASGLGALRRDAAWAGTVAVVFAFAATLWPAVNDVSSPNTLRIAAIQGNVPRMGLDFNEQRRAVLDNHVNETLTLAREVAAGTTEQPDLVIWPENSSDIDPTRNDDAAALIEHAVNTIGVPIVFGTIYHDPVRVGANDKPAEYNTVFVWYPGQPGPDLVDRHDKQILMPFGETIPARSFFRRFSHYVDDIGSFTQGDSDATIDVRTDRGVVPIGVATCYEVVFDRAFRESIDNGAQLLTVPTNNATFGRTDMTYQQEGISRVRAVEFHRQVAIAATSGVSAMVSPDGTITAETELFTADHLVAEVPLFDDVTLAARLGSWPERAAVLAAVFMFAWSVRQDGQNQSRQISGSKEHK